MRRNRRGHSSGSEFGESGADSFVAVVVTKLTGALLFILLLTMVIMALLPKVVDLPSSPGSAEADKTSLSITTPEDLPEGIAGRSYRLAFAAGCTVAKRYGWRCSARAIATCHQRCPAGRQRCSRRQPGRSAAVCAQYGPGRHR